MLAHSRRCLSYSKVYCDVRRRRLPAWNQNRHITYSIFHIPCTNFEMIIGFRHLHFVWWHGLNHCATLVRNLPTSILVRALVSLLTFHTSTILAPLWFTNFKRCRFRCRFQNLSISFLLLACLALHGRSCRTTLKILSSSFKKKHL